MEENPEIPKQNMQIQVPTKRMPLLLPLMAMQEEAFNLFATWAAGNLVQYYDELGGYQPESQKQIKALREAGLKYIEEL